MYKYSLFCLYIIQWSTIIWLEQSLIFINSLLVQRPRPQPICRNTRARGTQQPPADRPSDLLKGTIRGSLFHPEWPFVVLCRLALEGNVISHWLNGPSQRRDLTYIRTHTQTQVGGPIRERDLMAPCGASIDSSERVLMSCGWRLINRFSAVTFQLRASQYYTLRC